jgi:SAM-dependent methyltransferase
MLARAIRKTTARRSALQAQAGRRFANGREVGGPKRYVRRVAASIAGVEPPLDPGGHAACVVCGASATREVASASELEVQRRYLRRFHKRRLRTEDHSLEERAEFTQDYAARIVACSGCGLVLRDPQPSREQVARAYAADSYGPEVMAALYESQLELFRPKVRALAKRLPAGRPVVLEVGSFVGGFLAASTEAGWDAFGIDPGVEVADFCSSKGLKVLRENVDDLEFPEGAADCIAVWNTFDQLPDPHPALRSLARCVKPGGLAVFRVPNGECFEACMRWMRRTPPPFRSVLLAAMAWNNLLSFPYLHGYSPATLDRLLGQYGFERIDAEGDVLTRLADERTKTWAKWEELTLKAAWKAFARLAASSSRAVSAPWIDAYYRQVPERAAAKHSG